MFLRSRKGKASPNKAKASPIKAKAPVKKEIHHDEDDSSSDSDIGDYLQPMDKIDLRSPFFDVECFNAAPSKNEKKTSESDLSASSSEDEAEAPSSKSPFQELEAFSKRMEEAKLHIEKYKIKMEEEGVKKDAMDLEPGINGDSQNDSDSEKECWEEVGDQTEEKPSLVPKEDLQISVDMPQCVKKKEGAELLASIKRRINNMRKSNQLLVHKVHLLCWLAYGLQVSAVLSSEKVLARALSIVPSNQYSTKSVNLKCINQLLKWFKANIANNNKVATKWLKLETLLQVQLANLEAYDARMLVYIFVAVVRALGMQCRLVLSYRVEPVRPPQSELHSLSMKKTEKKQVESDKKKRKSRAKAKSIGETPKKQVVSDGKKGKSRAKAKSVGATPQIRETTNKLDREKRQSFGDITNSVQGGVKEEDSSRRTYSLRSRKHVEDNNNKAEPQRSKSVRFSIPVDIPQLDGPNDSGSGSDEDVFGPSASSSDSDEDVFVKGASPQVRRNSRRVVNNISSDNLGVDVWAEIYLEGEDRWISVDVVNGEIDCAQKLQANATKPLTYIVAYNNNGIVKEVTKRYCQDFNSKKFRELRVKPKWWQETLRFFVGPVTSQDQKEEEEFERAQLTQPLPTTIAEYKNHPLYVLRRHLLKYEAIYPINAPTLGFVRSEPVFARQCVYVLNSRDVWYKKHAKVVKAGETAYKIVRGRPRWDKLSCKIVTDDTEEVFGPWQVDDYDPPTAENGIVPRNEYGNVELFRPSMLPKKTVHLNLPGLDRVAKRMNIDCSPAINGFEYSGGYVHPSYCGFVVCEEFADILVAAWELDQEEIEKKEQERIEKRVYGNWKRFIKGLLIQEKLKAKYEFGREEGSPAKKRKIEG